MGGKKGENNGISFNLLRCEGENIGICFAGAISKININMSSDNNQQIITQEIVEGRYLNWLERIVEKFIHYLIKRKQ
ncbi:MAG: hypothetical protein V1698_00400 [bacterium]